MAEVGIDKLTASPIAALAEKVQDYFRQLDVNTYGTQHNATRKRVQPYRHLGDLPGLVDEMDEIVLSQAVTEPMWPNSDIFLPIRQTTKLEIKFSKLIFNPRFPAPLSEESVMPYLESSREQTSTTLEPYGQSVRYNMEALREPEGARLYMLGIFELVSNYHLHLACGAIDAAMGVDRNELEYQRIYMNDTNWYVNTINGVTQFAAAVKTPTGLFELVNRSVYELKTRRFEPTVFVVDGSKRSLAKFGSELTYTHYKGGQVVADRLYNSDNIGTIAGVPIYECPVIQNFDNMPEIRPTLMNRTIQFGEYYRIMMPEYEQYLSVYQGTDFGRSFLSPMLYNEQTDCYEVVPFSKIIENLMVFWSNQFKNNAGITNIAETFEDTNEEDEENIEIVYKPRFDVRTMIPVGEGAGAGMTFGKIPRNVTDVKKPKDSYVEATKNALLDFSVMLVKLSRQYDMSAGMVAAGGAGMGFTAVYPLRIDNGSDSANRTGFSSLGYRAGFAIAEWKRIHTHPFMTFAHVYREGSTNKFFTEDQFQEYYVNQKGVGVAPASLLALHISYDEPDPRYPFIDITGCTGNYGDTVVDHYTTAPYYRQFFESMTDTNGYAFAQGGNRICFRGNMWQVQGSANSYTKRVKGNGHHGSYEYDGCVAEVRAEGVHVYNQNPSTQ